MTGSRVGLGRSGRVGWGGVGSIVRVPGNRRLLVIVVYLPESISPVQAVITVPAKHHGESIVIFHLEIVIFHISIATFHMSGEVRWGGVVWDPL